ncbi:hypothetical protein [Actibacterium sp. D379-3]
MTRPVWIAAALLTGTPAFASDDLATLTAEQLMALRPTSQAVEQAGRFYNVEGVIPPQCYTSIEGKYNPCYVCHQTYDDDARPNYMYDGALQEAYNFSDAALTNHWVNLFVDRTADVAAISDDEILDYINTDNYAPLAERLTAQGWGGYVPDLAGYGQGAAAFDEIGIAKDGSGWVAFNYKPQPSTFWPTNGSTDDVLIRLPEAFRDSRDAYIANLGLLEIAFQDYAQTTVPPVDEAALGVDLDGDGALGVTGVIKRRATYVGGAAEQAVNRMRYPQGTEFLHSVRYVGLEGDTIVTPPHMKELRYMRKTVDMTEAELRTAYDNERQEKKDENLPRYIDVGDLGMDTGMGWLLLGFIEDADGALRPQTREEQFFCKGCHTTAGAVLDQTWAFPRKVAGVAGWGYIDYRAMRDVPSKGQQIGEIEQYFTRVGGGDEFRSNDEMIARWFNADGSVNTEKVRAATVYELIAPSRERALKLNKAYRVITAEQSFIFGRDATVTPPRNVHSSIDSATAPTLPRDKQYSHDNRLEW